MMPAAETYDVVWLRAGAGGMTAAAVAAAEGLRVLLVEKTEFIGGTTAWSGGMVWIPANTKLQQVGLTDSAAPAPAYLQNTVPVPAIAVLNDTFPTASPKAVQYDEPTTPGALPKVESYPDE